MTSDWVNPCSRHCARRATATSPIQAQAIPAVIKGRDVMAAAQTGTGKTAGFTLPLLERLRHGRRATRRQVQGFSAHSNA